MTHAATIQAPTHATAALTRRALIAALIMALAAALAWGLTPTHRLADENPIHLESMIPTAFGDWQIDAKGVSVVVNPQQTELLARLYTQTLSRTYINTRSGERVMLSIAYGEDQRDGMQMHYPEVCYPAQGFEVRNKRAVTLNLGGVSVLAQRLETALGTRRFEPVTYWAVVGNVTIFGGVSKKLAELRYGLRGFVVDGLLFRVSSINRDAEAAFAQQQRFAAELLTAIDPAVRSRFVGLDS